MDFIGRPQRVEQCPSCKGMGRMEYPNNFYPCPRCGGSGQVIKIVLTYPQYTDTDGCPSGRQFFAGEIERPYRYNDC